MKSLISIFVLFLIATSCGQKPISLTINGTVSDASLNGQYVYLKNYSDNKNIDTAIVVDSKFTFKVTQDTAAILRISLQRLYANLILEDGVIDVALARPSTISGAPLNDSLVLVNNKIDVLTKEFTIAYKHLTETISDKETLSKEVSMLKANVAASMRGIYKKSYDSNKENMLGVFSLWSLLQSDITYEESKKMVSEIGCLAETFGPIVRIQAAKAAHAKTQIGNMFVDFNAANPDGSAAKLSDYVGKGSYVLVDFWASWCGPCKTEIPFIQDIYKNYKDKGLIVLGVNVWDKPTEFKSSVENLGMTWNHITAFESKDATEAYGINGVPHIILFAPDGTIVERGLRGDKMKAKVAEMYK
jgi:thiol-disulfide isomerase/thioredoxin